MSENKKAEQMKEDQDRSMKEDTPNESTNGSNDSSKENIQESQKIMKQGLEFITEMKMGDILEFTKENEIDIKKSAMKVDSILEKQKKQTQQAIELQERLMRETLGLKLDIKQQSAQPVSSNNANENEMLYKKLEKKWGLSAIQETDEEKQFMSSLLDPSKDNGARMLAEQNFNRQKRKNITQYQSRNSHEIDPMMQGSHLDLKNDQTPKIMKYMDDFREFQPQINIGERWGQIIQKSTENRMVYEQQIAKGGNLISYMARTGKLGIDLYFILFGLSATFIIPFVIFQHQRKQITYIQKTKNINPTTVPDFYNCQYDLDEISIQKSFYNQFTQEIMEEKNKKLTLHKEIHKLTDMLFPNK